MSTPPTDCPYYLITRASLVLTATLRHELAQGGVPALRPSYLGVLMSLWSEDRLRGVELARRAGLEPSTLTGVLDRMERDGLVERAPDPRDRRAQQINLTALGRNHERPVRAVVDGVLAAALDHVAPEALAQAKDTLRQVIHNTRKLPASGETSPRHR